MGAASPSQLSTVSSSACFQLLSGRKVLKPPTLRYVEDGGYNFRMVAEHMAAEPTVIALLWISLCHPRGGD